MSRKSFPPITRRLAITPFRWLLWGLLGMALVAALVLFSAAPMRQGEPAAQTSRKAAAAQPVGSEATAVRVPPLPRTKVEALFGEFLLARTSERRREDIWHETMSGGNEEKLELAMRILEASPSAWTEPARELLQLYLGEDLGDDPAVWRRAVENRQRKLAQDRELILEKLREHRARFATP